MAPPALPPHASDDPLLAAVRRAVIGEADNYRKKRVTYTLEYINRVGEQFDPGAPPPENPAHIANQLIAKLNATPAFVLPTHKEVAEAMARQRHQGPLTTLRAAFDAQDVARIVLEKKIDALVDGGIAEEWIAEQLAAKKRESADYQDAVKRNDRDQLERYHTIQIPAIKEEVREEVKNNLKYRLAVSVHEQAKNEARDTFIRGSDHQLFTRELHDEIERARKAYERKNKAIKEAGITTNEEFRTHYANDKNFMQTVESASLHDGLLRDALQKKARIHHIPESVLRTVEKIMYEGFGPDVQSQLEEKERREKRKKDVQGSISPAVSATPDSAFRHALAQYHDKTHTIELTRDTLSATKSATPNHDLAL